MEVVFRIFIVYIYLAAAIFFILSLRLSGYMLTVAQKEKKPRFFLASLILLAIPFLSSLVLFRQSIGWSSLFYVVASIAILVAREQLKQAFPVKTAWIRSITVLSIVSFIGLPTLFFLYGTIPSPRVIQTEQRLVTAKTGIEDALVQTAHTLESIDPRIALEPQLNDRLAALHPSFIIIANTSDSIIYTSEFSSFKGTLSQWLPWTANIPANKAVTGISSLPNSLVVATAAYRSVSDSNTIFTTVVGYTLSQSYLSPYASNVESLALSADHITVWASAKNPQQRAILESRDWGEYLHDNLPEKSRAITVESSYGYYEAVQVPLTSLDEKSYHLTSLVETKTF